MKRDLVLEALVIEEATNLKKFATKEELERLDYDFLEGNNSNKCLYGQMTSSCNSERAMNLIVKCAKRVYNTDLTNTFNGKLNGKPKKIENSYDRLEHYISPIEKFLYFYKIDMFQESTKIKRLVNFLQDKTQTLKL